jgi:hypothetical protein
MTYEIKYDIWRTPYLTDNAILTQQKHEKRIFLFKTQMLLRAMKIQSSVALKAHHLFSSNIVWYIKNGLNYLKILKSTTFRPL